MAKYIGYSKCTCGATTVFCDDGTSYSTKQPALLPEKYKRLEKYSDTCNCNYCVNHRGLELCGCSSGELFGQCTCGYPECAFPMQVLNERQNVPTQGAWA